MYVPNFSAKDSEGRVQVELQNIGSISSAYFVSVSEWSDGLQTPGPAASLSLQSGESRNVTIRLYTVGEEALLSQFVTVQVVHGSTAEIFDTRTIEFDVSKTVIDCGAQCGDLVDDGDANRFDKLNVICIVFVQESIAIEFYVPIFIK